MLLLTFPSLTCFLSFQKLGLVRAEVQERRERQRHKAELGRRQRLVEETEHKQDALYGLYFDEEEYDAVLVDQAGAPVLVTTTDVDVNGNVDANRGTSTPTTRRGRNWDDDDDDDERTPASAQANALPASAAASPSSFATNEKNNRNNNGATPSAATTGRSPVRSTPTLTVAEALAIAEAHPEVSLEMSPRPKSAVVDPITIELYNRR